MPRGEVLTLFGKGARHDVRRGGMASPDLKRERALPAKHGQAIRRRDASRAGIAQEPGFFRAINDVKCRAHASPEFSWKGGGITRSQTQGGAVHNDGAVRNTPGRFD